MTMLTELQFTEARSQFSTLYDSVFNSFSPAIVKRKQTEQIAMLRVDLLKMVLEDYKLNPDIIQEDDGSITLALDALEVYINNSTLDLAAADLIEDLKLYAQDYLKRSQLFLHSPNRTHHFPYILRIMLCENDDEIRALAGL
ncbi:antitoxin of RelE/RelB toxin-antitoxin system [Desulfitobacterium sp. LBE]|uniref:exoribonuclease R n=1 Tax=Desulfitobacterium sp. LBE TaxID=884086 RepID=UPI0011990696|nr:antitoxin of RelE/RelB toxin-antitoxin system [Desulfitobacterium sp. LBE]